MSHGRWHPMSFHTGSRRSNLWRWQLVKSVAGWFWERLTVLHNADRSWAFLVKLLITVTLVPTSVWRWANAQTRVSRVYVHHYLNIINPLTPMPSVTGYDEPWPFFHFWRHNWHHLYSTSTGGKHLSNDAQIRVISQNIDFCACQSKMS